MLRRILRRAVRHAWLLGRREPTLAPLTDVVVAEMGAVYPELVTKRQGRSGDVDPAGRRAIPRDHRRRAPPAGRHRVAPARRGSPGEEAFKLYDTFGFPDRPDPDHRGRSVASRSTWPASSASLEEQRERSRGRAISAGKGPDRDPRVIAAQVPARMAKRSSAGRQKFVGYETDEAETDVLAFRQEGRSGRAGAPREPVLRRVGRPGQRHRGRRRDRGGRCRWTRAEGRPAARRDRRPIRRGVRAHDRASARSTHPAAATSSAITAPPTWCTTPCASVWAPTCGSRARWSSPTGCASISPTTGRSIPATLQAIERRGERPDLGELPGRDPEMAYPDALALGAMAFFSEKYGDGSESCSMGPSIELCGGTHVRSTGQIGLFRVTAQTGVAAGVRRIEAVTGPAAYHAARADGTPAARRGRGAQGPAGAPGAEARAAPAGAGAAGGSAPGAQEGRRRWRRSRAQRTGGGDRRRVRHHRRDRRRGSRRSGHPGGPLPGEPDAMASWCCSGARAAAPSTWRSPTTWSAPDARPGTW